MIIMPTALYVTTCIGLYLIACGVAIYAASFVFFMVRQIRGLPYNGFNLNNARGEWHTQKNYFKYIVRHKWFVFVAGLRLRRAGYKVGLWRLLIHDASKFLPSEWIPYSTYFYGGDWAYKYSQVMYSFNAAWLFHQHRNPHHWQYWVLLEDSGKTIPMPMPDKYMAEMVADWMGAGRAITGKWEAASWYLSNRDKMILSASTKYAVERMLGIAGEQEEKKQ